MKQFGRAALGALMMAGAALAASTPANAGVSVGIGIGIPAPGYYRYEGYYGPGYYPPGPCARYSYYYTGNCGYPAWTGPVYVGGVWYNGPHYYRYWGGRPWVWWHGGWRGYYGGWAGWRR